MVKKMGIRANNHDSLEILEQARIATKVEQITITEELKTLREQNFSMASQLRQISLFNRLNELTHLLMLIEKEGARISIADNE